MHSTDLSIHGSIKIDQGLNGISYMYDGFIQYNLKYKFSNNHRRLYLSAESPKVTIKYSPSYYCERSHIECRFRMSIYRLERLESIVYSNAIKNIICSVRLRMSYSIQVAQSILP